MRKLILEKKNFTMKILDGYKICNNDHPHLESLQHASINQFLQVVNFFTDKQNFNFGVKFFLKTCIYIDL